MLALLTLVPLTGPLIAPICATTCNQKQIQAHLKTALGRDAAALDAMETALEKLTDQ